ncbi:sulfurtransferase [Neisseria elongata subsp. glycolytica ATCC 29315]|uniref:Sulfurtransferase n=2 Tax=Neisseria elongata subsp. glycolytica ATCC 29315 TaxID=546263 RepID=A0A0B5CMQ5_NEIEG|nr:DNA phosphorothioation system sulfurtransferase DndC [Neisseria elongata]AJE17496.1 sulfurtransferase [Neisseria elongata subsp. glycolytica ATCC 29315]SQH49348.1 PUA domain (predicted RNA-binding domain) [Neisseria elongata subsp. glycolytica]
MKVIPINTADPFEDIRQNIAEEYLSETQHYPWIVTFSGGKDSTLVAHLVFDMLLSLPPMLRSRQVFFVSNDTLVESPLVVKHMRQSLAEILRAAEIFRLPVSGEITVPKLQDTFWTLLIGKGYPTPNRSMRWCTDRLKIQPTSGYILQKVNENGKAIIVLGVRKDESATRKASIESHQNLENSNLTPHSDLKNALVYRPIADLSTDDVWEFLAANDPPWGGTHSDLIKFYREAAGGECPIVLSQEEAPGCGTNSSRFGCWTCTVVNKDRSLQGFVDAGKTEFAPLIEYRNWLVDIRNKPEYRQAERRNGKLTFKSGKHIPGPFTITARQEMLVKLLEVQAAFGEELISQDEIDLIKQIWTEDILKQGDRR